jgi:SAM-dependent methyltransferase
VSVSCERPDEIAAIAERVPWYCLRILHIGCGAGSLAKALDDRADLEVYGVEWDAEGARAAANYVAAITQARPDSLDLSVPDGYFDAIVLSRCEEYEAFFARTLKTILPSLEKNGAVLYVLPLRPDSVSENLDAASDILAQANVTFYQAWPAGAADPPTEAVVMAVQPAYEPIAHGRALMAMSKFDEAEEVLALIPDRLMEADQAAARVECEKQFLLFCCDRYGDPSLRLQRFSLMQARFYLAAEHVPFYLTPYHMQSSMWERLGDGAMAARLLRTIQHVSPHDSTVKRLEDLGSEHSPESTNDVAPMWEEGAWQPRILYITHQHADFGLDMLYDGLCTVLGDDAVVDYPWKACLHGEIPESISHYPCLCDRGGEAKCANELARQLRAGEFDFVLFGAMRFDTDDEDLRTLMGAAEGVPVFVNDQQDDPLHHIDDVRNHLGGKEIAGYFKREMLMCHEYPAGTWPLSFAYPDGRIPSLGTEERGEDVFWAGQRTQGLRRLYLEHIERRFGMSFDKTYKQEEYAKALLHARIGIDIFGGGFDTARYWELAAHGCLLLAERKPIRIPHDFVDGETAVLFDDLPQLEDRLAHLLAHPEDVATIAAAGHRHMARYHTGSARAGQFLAKVQEVLGA